MKKIISLFLILSMITILSSNTFAFAEEIEKNSATYMEPISGDMMTIEALQKSDVDSDIPSTNALDEIYKTKILRNGIYEETISVDLKNNKLTHEYADGRIVVEQLSDVVKITPVEDTESKNNEKDTILPMSVDYVSNEHFDILANGDQAILSGATVYSGYRAMGNRGGYFYAPTLFGYLQRQNSGVVGTSYSNLFTFGAGTTIATAASIVYAFFTSTGAGLVLSVAISLIGVAVDLIIYDWSVVFAIKTYNWSYRVRLNSNTGSIIYTTYRNRDYWKCYNEATGMASFEYRGSKYDDGFLLANTEMIKTAIDSYIE